MITSAMWSVVFGALIAGMGQAGTAQKDHSGDCTSAACHGNLTQQKTVHDPVESESCDSCHEQEGTEGHKFKLTAEGSELCTSCHDEDEFTGKVKHEPVAEGACSTCHDPHGDAFPALLTAATIAEVCTECHDDPTEDRTHMHGPVATGSCTACHDAHASDHSGLLVADAKSICVKCHAALQSRITKLAHIHAPVEEECTACHDPHGANNSMMLTAALPILCFSCHDDVADAVADAEVQHAPLKQENGCAACHDSHGSDHSAMLRGATFDLCMSCHGKDIKTASGVMPGMQELLQDAKVLHGPIGERDCTTCHGQVHGGSNHRLLSAAYPSNFYAAYDESLYALCFDCHDAEVFNEPSTEELTGFRNGDLNLHYLHVSRKAKGRTCRACHGIHASKKPHLIAEYAPFGDWQIPLRFEKSESGGTCQPGCHRPYRYDRDVPVTNIQAPSSGPSS